MNINKFPKGSIIVRTKPAKPYHDGLRDRSLIGDPVKLDDVRNGTIYFTEVNGHFGERTLSTDLWSEGWEYYETPQKSSGIETTLELILAAAEKCPQAKESLKTLFPKVFDSKKKKTCFSHPYNVPERYVDNPVIEDGDNVYFVVPPANSEWMNDVIQLCTIESIKRKTWISSAVFDDKPYLGFRL